MTAHTNPAASARRGRRPGTNTTRRAILDAARARFAADGFTATTIRRVAADAGVDASLVMQFFRSKDELFAAVMSVPVDALERFSAAFKGTDDHLGERVVRAFLDVWEKDAQSSEPLMAMLRGAIVNEQANGQLREFLQERLLVDAVVSRDVDNPTLTEVERETLIALVGPAVQSVLAPASPATDEEGTGR